MLSLKKGELILTLLFFHKKILNGLLDPSPFNYAPFIRSGDQQMATPATCFLRFVRGAGGSYLPRESVDPSPGKEFQGPCLTEAGENLTYGTKYAFIRASCISAPRGSDGFISVLRTSSILQPCLPPQLLSPKAPPSRSSRGWTSSSEIKPH